jgi:predicted lipoprotein with Yx(FWY)xxD motif
MRTLPLAIAAFAISATAALAAAPVKTVSTEKGDVLAGENGMTLYTYKDDSSGTSTCYDKCAVNWPPLKADANAMAEGAYTVIERKDGTKQWAKDGMPLYYWIKDKKEGDVTGDGVGGEWDVARP